MNRVAVVFAILTTLSACSQSAAPTGPLSFPAAPFAVVDSTNGLVMEVRSAPSQPPSRGTSSIELTVRDAQGALKDGIDFTVVPWMPEMGHGASTEPTIAALGKGQYLLSEVDLFMPGSWELRATLGGTVTDSATIELQIP
jgi:hypothetical protein